MSSSLGGNSAKRKWNLRNCLGVVALLMLLACLVAFLWGCWHLRNWEPFTATSYYPVHPGRAKLSGIEGNAVIVLPPSAHEIYAYTTGLNEISCLVRFSMSSHELDEFMRSTLCQEPLGQMSYEYPRATDKATEWWTPDQAKHLEGCTGSDEHTHQTVRIDMTRTDVYVVFVSASTY